MGKRNRKETLIKLLEELKKLKDNNVEKLMRKGKKKELLKLQKSINYSFLEAYFKKEIYLDIEMKEITKEYLLEFVFFLHGCARSEYCILRDYKELQKMLEESGEEPEKSIAKQIRSKRLNEIPLKKLLAK